MVCPVCGLKEMASIRGSPVLRHGVPLVEVEVEDVRLLHPGVHEPDAHGVADVGLEDGVTGSPNIQELWCCSSLRTGRFRTCPSRGAARGFAPG
jgi:hypothetical protein